MVPPRSQPKPCLHDLKLPAMPFAPLTNPTSHTCQNCGTGWNGKGVACPNCGEAVPPHSDRWALKVIPWIMGFMALGSAGQGYEGFQATRLLVHAGVSDWMPVVFNVTVCLYCSWILVTTFGSKKKLRSAHRSES